MDVETAVDTTDATAVLSIRGELGIDSAPQLRTSLTDLVDGGITRIVVDLGALTFCDSIGLSAFADAHIRCTRVGGWLRLAAPSPFLLRTLSVVGLLAHIPVYDSAEAARTGEQARMLTP
jgi:anti-anti-sigma factor